MTLWYVSTPYSKYSGGIDQAFLLACEQSALLLKAGIPVYSPIAHCHSIAVNGGIDPLNHDLWMKADAPMMAACSGLIVVMADGWEQSVGMRLERAVFKAAEKPIYYMEPGEIPLPLLVP